MTTLGIDIGAAYVDLALLADGALRTAKVPALGRTADVEIVEAIGQAAREWHIGLSAIDDIRIGSTGAVNLLLTRQGARIGLITTAGFADTLLLARQNRADLYDPIARSPSPHFLVSPGSIHEVEGRLDPEGTELAPLDVEQVRRAAGALMEAQVEAIAVCLLFSYANAAHEDACAAILEQAAPGIPIVLSHRIDGNAREYERTVSTCLEAALRPSQRDAMSRVESELAGRGFGGRLSFADSRGFLLAPSRARQSVITQLVGGPASSALAAAALSRRLGIDTALSIDAGSTSTDIVLIEKGMAAATTHCNFAGIPLRVAMTDVESIPVGGGSRIEAGSFDGTGDENPTLTDALVVLGALAADLSPGAGQRLSTLAARQGQETGAAAAAIRDKALDDIAAASIRYAVGRNVDPATVPLIVSGGLGKVIACGVAERLGIQQVVVGPGSPVSGALGLLDARHVHERACRVGLPLDALTDATLGEIIGRIGEHDGTAEETTTLTIAPNAFMHPVTLRLGHPAPTVPMLRDAFEAYHRERFGSPSREAGFVFSLGRLSFEDNTDRWPDTQSAGGLADAPVVQEGWDCHTDSGVLCLTRRSEMAAFRPETLQMRLNSIAQSMQEMLFRTAVSPVVREGNDAAAALLSATGELVALSDAIPLLLGALDGSVRAILDRFPQAEMREGDLYLMNDPFLGGTHLPDITVVQPVFEEGSLLGFAASILHHQDLGGMRAGSVPPDAIDIYQEGLRLPPMRMGRAGVIDPTIVELISANSRAADTVLGDLASQVGAAARAAEAMRQLAREAGTPAFLQGVSDCLDRGEAVARAAIGRMSDGPHRASEALDPTPGLPDIRIELALDCGGGTFRADFTGTTPQVAAPINCVRSGPFAASFYALLSAIGPTVFRNGGVVRAIDLVLPDECAINASAPAAVNARMGMVRATTSALLQALAKAMPGRMPAANSGMSYVLAFSGRQADGRRFIATEIIAGGAGGGPDADGAAGISTDVGNAMNMPAEALEQMIPVRLVSASVRRGSGGAGRFRGGDGICRVYLALEDGISVSLRGERFRHVPSGFAGGGAPRPSQASVARADGSVEILATRSTPILNKGDRLVVESCGGAGYGVAG